MDLVGGSNKLEQIFGGWPSFHDAEVLSICLDRSADGAVRGPTIRLVVHVFEMTDAVDSRGYYVLRSHVLVTLALHSAEVVRLEGFNQQNVLSGLRISKPSQPLLADLGVQVDLESTYGVEATFQCASAEVVSVEAYKPPERAA